MPWIDKNMCDGCEICVEQCPVGSIAMVEGKAEIDMESCIRCGTCHKICPQNASRHDSEKIPEEIETNLNWIRDLLAHYDTEQERGAFLKRIKRYFQKEIKVNEQTLEKIDDLLA